MFSSRYSCAAIPRAQSLRNSCAQRLIKGSQISELNSGSSTGLSQISSANENGPKLMPHNQPGNMADSKGEVVKPAEPQSGSETANHNQIEEEVKAEVENEGLKEEGTKQAAEDGSGGTDESSCKVDIKELTSQIMSIINDGNDGPLEKTQLLKINVDLQEFIIKLIELLREKTNLCANLDRQNEALTLQVKSLKDVIGITKNLLGIRNMEIEHLHADLNSIEQKVKEERERHNMAVDRLAEAMKLNDSLKNEYLTQMDLFNKLKQKYTEKVVLLTKENQRLKEVTATQGPTDSVESETNGLSTPLNANITED